MNQEIRDGTLSQRLLRPVHPILAYSAENLAAVPLRGALVLPVALLMLFVRGRAQLTADPLLILCALFAMPGAWAITFLSMTMVGALAFFIDSSLALFQVWMGSYMLFSGYLVPLSLLPGWLRGASEVLPFRYMLEFPVKLMMGLPHAGGGSTHLLALHGLCVEYGYVAAFVLFTGLLWRLGLRHYESFGA
jgi:ABC-2 type transport system permease protein